MNEMVKKVARAIINVAQGRAVDSHVSIDELEMWEETAHAAIVAMREPTEAMKIAGYETNAAEFNPSSGTEQAATIWKAMIDEALR